MIIGIVGKPNVGKSTFFTAATEAPAEVANYPFTTIEKNVGVGYVRHECPHKEFGVTCTPNNSRCVEGTRFIPVKLIDVAGLVPKAHEGKGRGNQFLDDLMEADALIHIVDVSGTTDAEGNVTEGYDPREDINFLEDEIAMWVAGILGKNWDKFARTVDSVSGKGLEKLIADQLGGLRIKEGHVHNAIRQVDLSPTLNKWTRDDIASLCRIIIRQAKPMLIAANKADKVDPSVIEELRAATGLPVIPTMADFENALRKANKAGLIDYTPGDASFQFPPDSPLNQKQKDALALIGDKVSSYGSTGVQQCLEKVVFETLELIAAYPVEDETHLTDKEGRVLPDAHLLVKGSTAKDLAYKVHTDLGDKFIRAINARTKRVIGATYEVQDGDVIKIVSNA